MQLLTSINGTSDAYNRSIATTHAASLAALSQLEEGLISNDFIGLEDAMDGGLLEQWRLRLSRDLPGSQAVLCLDSTPDDGDTKNPSCDGAGQPVIKVLWVNSSRQDALDGGVRRVMVPAL
jgi:type IV pilus assembly protein PilV